MMVGFRNLEKVSTDTLIWTHLDFVYHNNLNTIMLQQCNKINSVVLGLVFLTHVNSDLINHAASSNKPLVWTKKKGGITVTGSVPHQRWCGAVLKDTLTRHRTFIKLSSFLAHFCDQYFTLAWKSPTLSSEGFKFKNWFIFGFWKVLKVSVGRLLQTSNSWWALPEL